MYGRGSSVIRFLLIVIIVFHIHTVIKVRYLPSNDQHGVLIPAVKLNLDAGRGAQDVEDGDDEKLPMQSDAR